ncbi:MAG: PIG-L deacetylase family protein [Saprospiraceae bacterium]|nr:PIG-L deacetylase family protein [Saprospiraceae bacterium]
MIKKIKKVLILAPHTDDGEFGCGGTIAKLIEEGCEVYYMAFSVCEQSVPYGFKEDELERELMNATRELGIPESNVIIKRYEVRRFPEHRQEILQDMIDIRSKIHPDLVFMPTPGDIHQDHQVISAEGIRAFKHSNIFCYEMIWNNISITTSGFFKLDTRHVQKKADALKCYKTQEFRNYANSEFVFSLAKTRGVQIGCEYAEAFQVIRFIS